MLAQILLVAVVGTLIYSVYYGLNYCWTKIGIPEERRNLLLRYSIVGILLWLTFLAALVRLRFFEDFYSLPPKIGVAILPPLVLIIYLMFSR